MSDHATPEEQREFLADMGMALVLTQTAEQLIRLTLHMVLPANENRTAEESRAIEAMLDDRMLGQLLNMVRSRAGLHDSLDALLSKFRVDRNNLIHHQDRIEGFDRTTAEGVGVGRDWLASYSRNALKISQTFAALNLAWQRQVGFATEYDQALTQFIGAPDVEELANTLFFAKD